MPEHIKVALDRGPLSITTYICSKCRKLWPCAGAYEELREVAEKALLIPLTYPGDRYDRFERTVTGLKTWIEQELLPVLKAGE